MATCTAVIRALVLALSGTVIVYDLASIVISTQRIPQVMAIQADIRIYRITELSQAAQACE